jgi:hypothetical protein
MYFMKAKKKNNPAKMALFAGAAALVAFAPQSHAQSSDALIDKLVDKGILTADEAKDLRDQADNDFKAAFQAKTGMPDWVTSYKIGGDFRGRFDQITAPNNENYVSRDRFRYRLRFGIVANMLDNMEVGFRLGSGDAAKGYNTGNPLSSNSTMQDNASKKNIYIDTAYAKWTALNSGNWLLAATIGKMENPFNFTPMVFDPDLTPEGAAITGAYTFNDVHTIAFTGAAFVQDEEAGSTQDPALYGGQVLLNSKWTPKLASSVGAGVLFIGSPQQLTTANVPYINQGNTRYSYIPAGGSTSVVGLKYNFNPVIADANVTYTLDSFPFQTGTFPIKVGGEFIDNPACGQNNLGYWLGATLGKSGTRHTWDLSYRYEWLESDAWYDQLVDDDNGAYYAPTVAGGTTSNYSSQTASAGWYGGTNIKGHLVRFNYSFTDSLTFGVTCFVNELINAPQPTIGPAINLNSTAIHIMADMIWKF